MSTLSSPMGVFGWWPSLAMAHLGQFLGVWLAVLGPGLANQSQPYAWSLARIERPNRSFDPSQARASSWLSSRHLCYFSQCLRPTPTPTPSARAWRRVFQVVPAVAEAKPLTPVVLAVAEAEAGVSAQTLPRSPTSPSPPRSLWPPRLPLARTPWRRWAQPRTPWTPRASTFPRLPLPSSPRWI